MSENLDCISSAEELEQILAVAFGPEGRAVMVQQPTGQFNITRSGYSILTAICPEPDPKQPARCILIDCARRVHESLGDGVKTFIIMTSSLLKSCKSVGNPRNVAGQLSTLGMQLSSFQGQGPELPAVSDTVLAERIVCFETIIRTFFSTRFPAPVCNSLSLLLCQWILSNTGNTPELKTQSYSQHTLQTLLKDFSMLCQYKNGGYRPVSDSSVQEGYRLCRPAINLSVSGPCRIQFLMLGDSDRPGSGCFDDIDVQSEVERFILKLGSESCEYERILLVTSAILSDLTLFRLRRLNVAVVQGILPEEVGYIYSVMSRLRQAGSRGTVIHVKPEVDCTWLEIPNIYQLILHAPTPELSTEYACCCQSAIKLCIVAASHAPMPDFSPCIIKAGGCFERALQLRLAAGSGKSLLDPLSCGVASRAELLEWHKQHRAVPQTSQSTVTGNNTSQMHSRGQVEHLGTGVKHSLRTTSLTQIPDSNDLHDSFSKMTLLDNVAMDQVLQSVTEACTGLDADVVGAIMRALLAVQRRLPRPDKVKQNSALEPVSLKLCILQHSVCAATSLIRVSGTLQVRKRLPSRGRHVGFGVDQVTQE